MEESEEFECYCCSDMCSKTDYRNCEICSEDVCVQCKKPRRILNFNDWLTQCPNYCFKCKRVGCEKCISTCIQCWNISEKYPFYCKDCSDLVIDDCEYHHWTLCKKHKKTGCPECKSNKNYSRYDF